MVEILTEWWDNHLQCRLSPPHLCGGQAVWSSYIFILLISFMLRKLVIFFYCFCPCLCTSSKHLLCVSFGFRLLWWNFEIIEVHKKEHNEYRTGRGKTHINLESLAKVLYSLGQNYNSNKEKNQGFRIIVKREIFRTWLCIRGWLLLMTEIETIQKTFRALRTCFLPFDIIWEMPGESDFLSLRSLAGFCFVRSKSLLALVMRGFVCVWTVHHTLDMLYSEVS